MRTIPYASAIVLMGVFVLMWTIVFMMRMVNNLEENAGDIVAEDEGVVGMREFDFVEGGDFALDNASNGAPEGGSAVDNTPNNGIAERDSIVVDLSDVGDGDFVRLQPLSRSI